MIRIEDIQSLCHDESIALTSHAKNRLQERGISIENVKTAIINGEIIEHYKDDKPFESCLVSGNTELSQVLHVVASIGSNFLFIITAYYPDVEEWESDFKTRKE